jgi:hypothetical protein
LFLIFCFSGLGRHTHSFSPKRVSRDRRADESPQRDREHLSSISSKHC